MGKGTQDATLPELVKFSLVAFVLPGLAVSALSVVVRDAVGGWFGAAMLVPAIVGFGYALMGLGGAMMFALVFILDRAATKGQNRPIQALRVAWLFLLFLTIPLSAVLLGFDRDQWVFGVGSTAAGFAIALYALVVLPWRRQRRVRR